MSKAATLHFPKGFLWGTATSSHQVEGYNDNNDWWDWEQIPGHIYQDQRSGIACDWWNRAEEDLERAAQMGQNTHRLSLEWSRIEPRENHFNADALMRYRRLLERMHELGLEPMVTLHHFTNPRWVAARGGWLNPAIVSWFERYTAYVIDALGDLVRLWCTINEPNVYAWGGYLKGHWPPGRPGDLPGYFRVLRHMTQAHGAAYRLLHRRLSGIQVGIAHHVKLFVPTNPASPFDRWVAKQQDQLFNRLIFDAMRTGELRFPLGILGALEPRAVDAMDYIGINYYSRYRVAFDPTQPMSIFGRTVFSSDALLGPDDWGEIDAEGFYQVLHTYGQFGRPIIVTENGCPDATDELRPRFILEHLTALHRAIQDGIDIRGYYFWTLVDNFEWAEGYDPRYRFGLIAVDPETQKRTIKPSGELYAAICKANAITPAIRKQIERT